MVLEGHSEMGEAAIIHRAIEYFVGGLNLTVVSQTARAVSFDGEAGTVNVSVSEDGPDSNVQILAEGLDEEATTFMDVIATITDQQ